MKLDLDSGMHNFTGIKVNHDSEFSYNQAVNFFLFS